MRLREPVVPLDERARFGPVVHMLLPDELETGLLEDPLRAHVVPRDGREQRAMQLDVKVETQCRTRDAPPPVGTADDVRDLTLARRPEGGCVADDFRARR